MFSCMVAGALAEFLRVEVGYGAGNGGRGVARLSRAGSVFACLPPFRTARNYYPRCVRPAESVIGCCLVSQQSTVGNGLLWAAVVGANLRVRRQVIDECRVRIPRGRKAQTVRGV